MKKINLAVVGATGNVRRKGFSYRKSILIFF